MKLLIHHAHVQMRVNGFVIGSVLLSMILNWFAGRNTCANYAVAWYGPPSLVLEATFLAAAAVYLTMPRRQKAGDKYEVLVLFLFSVKSTHRAEAAYTQRSSGCQLSLASMLIPTAAPLALGRF
jgi:hypothetical protein